MSAGSVVQIIGTPGNSPALKYELQLTEATVTGSSKSITIERVNLCLSILDDLIPKLGVFQRVVKLLKTELYNAIFSDEYTAEGNKLKKTCSSHGDDKTTPTRVAYFTIAKRCMEEKDKEVSRLKRQIYTLKEQLYTCEADLEKASSVIEGLKHDIKECENRTNGLSDDLQNKTKDVSCLQAMASDVQQRHDSVKTKLEEKILGYKNVVASQEVSINELKNYKTIHDRLQKTFSSIKGNEVSSSGRQTTTIKDKLQREIDIANTMEEQLLQMQNLQIDQYETLLDTLSRKEDKNKLKMNREKFKIIINEIDRELSQLFSHKTSLKFRLDQLSSIDPTHPHKAIITPDHPYCPLVTQEQLLNKYAAMLHASSDNGIKYYPIKEADMCQSCGEKVIVCPHWPLTELVIQLPLNSTHIKLTRPQLYTHAPSTLVESNEQVVISSLGQEEELETSPLNPDIGRIWKHFHSQYNSVSRSAPRQLSVEFLLMIMSKFYSSELAQDKAPPTNSTHSSITLPSLFYQFVIERYYLKQIGQLVIQDLITALQEYAKDNVYLLVFGHVLAGTLDGVVFRYQLLYAELVTMINWSIATEGLFMKWSAVVYKDIEEDELEQYSIDYIGHSCNITSSKTVLSYLTMQLIKFRDPTIKQAESMLSDQNTTHTGSMNEAEFAETCLLLCPSSDTLAIRLYSQTVNNQQTTDRRVSTRQLAYILGYVLLLDRLDNIRSQLNQFNIIEGGDSGPDDLLITLASLEKDIKN